MCKHRSLRVGTSADGRRRRNRWRGRSVSFEPEPNGNHETETSAPGPWVWRSCRPPREASPRSTAAARPIPADPGSVPFAERREDAQARTGSRSARSSTETPKTNTTRISPVGSTPAPGSTTNVSSTATGDCIRWTTGLSRVPISLPPIETTDQLLNTEPKFQHVEGALGRGVAADPVTVGHDQRILPDTPRRFGRHRAMRNVHGIGDVFLRERFP